MRAYSQSQGQFIDVPDQSSGGVPATTNTGNSGGGVDVGNDVFKQAALKDLLTTGGKNISNLKAAQDIISPASKGLSTAAQARHDSLQTALSSLDAASSNLITAGGAKGPLLGGLATTALGPIIDPSGAAYHSTKIELATQLAKAITGGARPGESVIQQYLHSLPDVNDTPQFAQKKIDKLYSELLSQSKSFKFEDLNSAYAQQGSGPATDQSGPQNEKPTLLNQAPGFLSSILGIDKLKNLGSNINNLPQSIPQAVQEMQQKGPLGAPSPELRAALTPGGNAQNYTGNRFIDSAIGAHQAVSTSQGAAGAIATPLIAANMGINAIKGGARGLGNLLVGGDKSVLKEGMNLVNEGSGARNSVIQTAETAGKTIDGSVLTNQIKEWGQNAIKAGEDSKVVQEKIAQATKMLDGKSLSPTESKSLWDAASQGFKDNGKAGNTVLAGYQRALRDGLRAELEKVAPGFEKGTAQIAEGLTKNKILKSVSDSVQKTEIKQSLKSPIQKILSNPAVKTGGALLGGAEIMRILQGK